MVKVNTNQQTKSIIMISDPKNIKFEVLHKIIARLVLEMHLMMPRLVAILNIAIYSGSGGLNQQTKYIIMFSGPTNIKNEVLHKIIVLLVLMMHLLVSSHGGHFEYRDLRPFRRSHISAPRRN